MFFAHASETFPGRSHPRHSLWSRHVERSRNISRYSLVTAATSKSSALVETRVMKSAKDTVVVFDIRNFSAHRYRLGLRKNRGAKLVKKLIEDLLRCAIKLLGDSENPKKEHLLNYTGDGFVLVVRGSKNQLRTLRWISEFREKVLERIEAYNDELERTFPKIKAELKRLDFGIGAHFGIVIPFKFKTFGGEHRDAFLGSVVNVASRVEQCTKDHACNVICTRELWDEALKYTRDERHRKELEAFRTPLGSHRLRGFPRFFQLYCLKTGFHNRVSVDKKRKGQSANLGKTHRYRDS